MFTTVVNFTTVKISGQNPKIRAVTLKRVKVLNPEPLKRLFRKMLQVVRNRPATSLRDNLSELFKKSYN